MRLQTFALVAAGPRARGSEAPRPLNPPRSPSGRRCASHPSPNDHELPSPARAARWALPSAQSCEPARCALLETIEAVEASQLPGRMALRQHAKDAAFRHHSRGERAQIHVKSPPLFRSNGRFSQGETPHSKSAGDRGSLGTPDGE